MKHVLILLTALSAMAVMTLRSQMEVLHDTFGINFVYDSSLSLDIPYEGEPMKDMVKKKSLEECLQTLFRDTEIQYEVNRKYVVLTRKDSRKKPKDYMIFIEEQRDTINESVITALVDPKRNSTQTGLQRLDSRKLNSGFALFSTPDVIKTLQMMPGVSSGTELLSGFYVHGGDGSDNLYLLDGVPIYQVSHLLGLFSSFNTDVIDGIDFYKSGFPARYGSKLSSIVDVTTKDGDFEEFHGKFSVGLIDGRFQLEGPLWKGRTSFNVGLRRTWTETVTVPVFAYLNKTDYPDKVNARYAFSDFNAKITHRFSGTNRLSANFYSSRDAFKLYTKGVYDDYDDYGNVLERSDIVDVGLSWGNILGSLNWDYELNDRMSMKNIAYYSGSISNLYLTLQENDYNGNSTRSGEYNNSDVHNFGLKSDFYHIAGPVHKLRYGATLQYHLYCPNATSKMEYNHPGMSYTDIPYSDSLRCGTVEAAVYAEDEMALTDAFSVNAGLRYSLNASGGKVWHSLEPRLAMKYTFNQHLAAKASYTEMSQPAHLVSSIYLDLPTNAWLPSTRKVRPSRSREVAAGMYANLPHNLHLNVEGWYKHMYHLLEYAGSYSVFPPISNWESCYKSGTGRSWGAELDFGYSNGKTEANVYYTLSWSQRKFDDFYHTWYRDRNDNRHKLTLMARHKFGKRLEVYGAWNWHSGNRITMATHSAGGNVVYSEPNNVKLPDYHRLDLGLNFVKNTKRGNTSIWNLSIYNAYCRTNPLASSVRDLQLDGKTVAYYAEAMGIIPIVPTFSYTLKF